MKNKRGFQQVNAIIGGVIGMVLLIIIAFLFFTNLTTSSLVGTNTYAANASNVLVGNFSTGVNSVASNIPTAFAIGVFIFIVILLLTAWIVARKSGLLGGGQLG